MKSIYLLFTLIFTALLSVHAQEPVHRIVFKNQPLNFGGQKGTDVEAVRLMSGRVVYKKVTMPTFRKGTDVKVKLTVRSNGDRWDKSGSCFVVSDPKKLSILSITEKEAKFPKDSYIDDKYAGYVAGENYNPVVELMRFMTPFGVGHYSDNKVKNRRPVYIPTWEKQVVWEHDITDLESLVTGTFYIGVWIDSWTAEGYDFDLELIYSNRKQQKVTVLPLVNTIPYVGGQQIPDNFAHKELEKIFLLKKNIKNVKLHYITTGHGGHSGGDEFIKLKNSVYFDNKLVLDTIPWRDDCASFRRFNPTSGVWLKKDSVSYINSKTNKYDIKEIEERLASSDLSRSNWCPGSSVEPMVVKLNDLKAGSHVLRIKIPATPVDGDKLNHWLISAYLTYDEAD
ncbi:MAG: N-glycanase [Flavobacterium sp.]|uniref:PNGase F N-terminal domain-containing protein n=1 Tax=Flavobacterium sp. TaxID=239 RepID=UPI001B45203C|nr:PNGase F N-terminal domain-containing protein [Flavobacterium sp.]MBP6145962.1 N-glycanase [Flavobacterium sp.]MBP7316908.1 N-glycanase [Flavobacterium sp.]MBP7396284.1 N-glycanase [Flavobacterium sp.]MBP8887536.1 N-glycanase [Flavobacterium sp.]HRM47015.1 PNGase F N-terminal domain-containing protein [Flavobacterium sp.]